MSRPKHKEKIHKGVKDEQNKRSSLLNKCWSYLNDNFENFTQENKIKISLELCKKDIPQEVKGDLFGSAEISKALAGLNPEDIRRVIDTCRARTGEERPV